MAGRRLYLREERVPWPGSVEGTGDLLSIEVGGLPERYVILSSVNSEASTSPPTIAAREGRLNCAPATDHWRYYC